MLGQLYIHVSNQTLEPADPSRELVEPMIYSRQRLVDAREPNTEEVENGLIVSHCNPTHTRGRDRR